MGQGSEQQALSSNNNIRSTKRGPPPKKHTVQSFTDCYEEVLLTTVNLSEPGSVVVTSITNHKRQDCSGLLFEKYVSRAPTVHRKANNESSKMWPRQLNPESFHGRLGTTDEF